MEHLEKWEGAEIKGEGGMGQERWGKDWDEDIVENERKGDDILEGDYFRSIVK